MGMFSSENSYLGVDIGSSSIKIVELKKEGKEARLLTYGFSENSSAKFKDDWLNNPSYAAQAINKICENAGTVSRSAIAALPTFSVFSSVLNLSSLSDKDIASSVHWEAKKVIPLPLEEMVLDWKKIEDGQGEPAKGKKNIKVLLTGAPKALIKKYINIFKEAKINLLSLETETFSLVRALLGNDKSAIMIVEIGASTTDISIINKSIPMLNRSIDVGGLTITKAIRDNLKIDIKKAEQFKNDLGISSIAGQDNKDNRVPKIIMETVDPIVNEIKYAFNLFQNKSNIKVEKIVLSGGSALLVNFVNYLAKILDIKIIIGDPWARISYPGDLKPVLNEIGPRMSVAVGLALRRME